MDMNRIKKWALAAVALLAVIIAVQIVVKKIRISAAVAAPVQKVGVVTAAASEIDEKVVMQGVAEGDPQVKVYPLVSGKFERAVADEGGSVKKDDVILYINRDMVGGMDYQLAPVKSPSDGIVTRIYFSDKGAAVSPSYPVAEVTDPSRIKVVLNIGEEDMVKIKKGMPAQISPVYGGGPSLEGSVYSSTPFIDRDTLSGTVIVRAVNTGRVIMPGMSVNVAVSVGKRKAMMLPESAVLMGEGKTYVYINDNGKAKRVDVTLGYMSGDMTEVSAGLTEGMAVVNEGNFKLNEGTKIDIK